ncbi:hypothetical protein Pelo_5802 [Pelomyxa schiedti]|nr:hypothetical protein Pelo_5802 [Pelomyxa schiedti]
MPKGSHTGRDQSKTYTIDGDTQFIALALGVHPRCGVDSPVRILPLYLIVRWVGKRWVMAKEKAALWVIQNNAGGGAHVTRTVRSYTGGSLSFRLQCHIPAGMTVFGMAGNTAVIRATSGEFYVLDSATKVGLLVNSAVQFDGGILMTVGSLLFGHVDCKTAACSIYQISVRKFLWVEFTTMRDSIPSLDELSTYGTLPTLENPSEAVLCLMHIDLEPVYSARFASGKMRQPTGSIRMPRLQSGILKYGSGETGGFLLPVQSQNGRFSFVRIDNKFTTKTEVPNQWTSPLQKVSQHTVPEGMTVFGMAGNTAVIRATSGEFYVLDPATRVALLVNSDAPFDGFISNEKWAVLYCRNQGHIEDRGELVIWPCGLHEGGLLNLSVRKFLWVEFTKMMDSIPSLDELSTYGTLPTLEDPSAAVMSLMHLDLEPVYASRFVSGRTQQPTGSIKIPRLQSGILKYGSGETGGFLLPVQSQNGRFSFVRIDNKFTSKTEVPNQWTSPLQKVDDTHFAVVNSTNTQLSVFSTSDLTRPCCLIPLSPKGCQWTTSGNGFIMTWNNGYDLYDVATGAVLCHSPGFALNFTMSLHPSFF